MKELKDLKLLDIEKIMTLSKEKIKEELSKSERNFFILKMKKETRELKQTHLMKFLRRYIARLKTITSSQVD
jgi:ribosomal protein L29